MVLCETVCKTNHLFLILPDQCCQIINGRKSTDQFLLILNKYAKFLFDIDNNFKCNQRINSIGIDQIFSFQFGKRQLLLQLPAQNFTQASLILLQLHTKNSPSHNNPSKIATQR